MATQVEAANGKAPRKRAAAERATKSRRAPRARGRDIGELERIIINLENRINQLTSRDNIRQTVVGATDQVSDAVSRASTHVGEYVADSIFNVADRVRNGASSVTGAAKAGTNVMQRVGAELERRPMMTVAIALGIGFLAGLAGRRDAA